MHQSKYFNVTRANVFQNWRVRPCSLHVFNILINHLDVSGDNFGAHSEQPWCWYINNSTWINSGVQVQEGVKHSFSLPHPCLWRPVEVLTELHRSQESAYTLRDTARSDHLNRAKICSKIIKYPHVEDYAVRVWTVFVTPDQTLRILWKLALKEHDEKQLYVSRQNLFDIRNIYAVMTDIIHKNISKASQPTMQ